MLWQFIGYDDDGSICMPPLLKSDNVKNCIGCIPALPCCKKGEVSDKPCHILKNCLCYQELIIVD